MGYNMRKSILPYEQRTLCKHL